MPFGFWAWMGPRNSCVRWHPDPFVGRCSFEGGKYGPLWSIGTCCHELCKNCWTDHDAIRVDDSGGPGNYVLDGGPAPLMGIAILGRGGESAALSWSRCRLFGLRWVQGSMCQVGAHWRHLANTMELFVCGGDAVCCQITLTTCCCQMHLRAMCHQHQQRDQPS